jgi:hypothetical protein
MTKYQKAKYICDMLAEEAVGHGLNMQVIVSELSSEELATLEKVAQRCRNSRASQGDPETVTFVLDWEAHLA